MLTSADIREARMTEELSPEAIDEAERIIAGAWAVLPDDRRDTYLCHGNCELGAVPMVTALGEFASFLEDNPNEVLIFLLEDYITSEDTEAAFEESGLIDHVHRYEGGEWPTLRRMIDDGTRVLVMSEHGGGDPDWYHEGFELTQETAYRFESIDLMRSDESCAPNRGQADSPLFQLNHFISPADPVASATVNDYQFLLDRALKCQEIRDLVPNLVAVNFWGIGDVVEVVDEINGVR